MENKEAVQQQMFDRIDQWQKSGLSQKVFCQQISLSYHIFHYWYKRYRITKSNAPSSFVKLSVSSTQPSIHAELILADGRRLVFHQPLSIDYLKALIN